MSNKRLLIMRLRRQVQVHRQHDVEPLSDGRERHTCRECKTSVVVKVAPPGADSKVIERLSRYRAKGGVYGLCKNCSKIRAAERYPLPE